MPQLRSCYFCGAVGDSLREYDLAPDDLAPAGGPHSAILCSTCHEKLRRVLEPLSDEGSAGSEPEPAPSVSQSITFGDGSDASDPDDSTPTDADAGDADDGAKVEPDVPNAGPEAPESAAAENDGSEAASPDGTTEPDDDPDVPDAYYKVLRLLQNREFPMERTALTALVTAAYDVSEPECERILETAIERGVLVEDGSTVDLGRN